MNLLALDPPKILCPWVANRHYVCVLKKGSQQQGERPQAGGQKHKKIPIRWETQTITKQKQFCTCEVRSAGELRAYTEAEMDLRWSALLFEQHRAAKSPGLLPNPRKQKTKQTKTEIKKNTFFPWKQSTS